MINFQRFKSMLSIFGPYLTQSEINKLEQNRKWNIFTISPPFNFNKDVKSYNDPISELTSAELGYLQDISCKSYLIINFQWEGYSYIQTCIYEIIHQISEIYNIPSCKIFLITGNIKEEVNYKNWANENRILSSINVLSLIVFIELVKQKFYLNTPIIKTISNLKKNNFIFLSMNNRKKKYRNYTVYKIFSSNFLNRCLISYDKFNISDFEDILDIELDKDICTKLIESSPKILDTSIPSIDFSEENESVAYPKDLFKESMISLVSETWIDDIEGTSLFYSEKTFKPMLFNHPLIIFGQKNSNILLEELGFQNYSRYFNLDFDKIENNFHRIDSIVSQIEGLNFSSISNRLDWFYSGIDIIQRNKEEIRESTYNKSKIQKFFEIIKKLEE
jgi:hypothetical protein